MSDQIKTRPTSPHLSIYKWQMGNSLSIMHRISGAGLYASIHILAWYFVLNNTIDCECLKTISQHILFKIMLLLSLLGYMYHALNGIRHLGWDAGYGYELRTMRSTGTLVLIGSIALTIISAMYIIG